MTPRKQSIKHDPKNGQYGDCMRTCIAALLDVPNEEVPHFAHDFPEGPVIWERIDEFLRPRGYAVFTLFCDADVSAVLNTMQFHNPGVYYLLGCAGPRTDHMVVACGDQIVCDPAGYDPAELKRGSDGYLWISVLVPLSMTA